MLYREIIAVCSQIHTKHINTLCGQNVEFLNVVAVRTVNGYTTAVSGILDMRPLQQHDLQTHIKFHYRTSSVRTAPLLAPSSTVSLQKLTFLRLAKKFKSIFCMLFVQTPPPSSLCNDPYQSNQTLPPHFLYDPF